MTGNEAKVYLDSNPVGTIKIVDGQLLLYPVQKEKRHITTQSLNEVIHFFFKESQERTKQ